LSYIYPVKLIIILQRYKILILFILVLNNISCNENTKTKNMGSNKKLKIGDGGFEEDLSSRQSVVGSRQSAVGSQQSAVSNQQSAISSQQ